MILCMNQKKDLSVTSYSSLYEGENNADYIKIIIPKELNGINISDCSVTLNIVNQDNMGDIIEFTDIQQYDDNYDYSEFCISNKFTYKPGNIQLWVEVLNAEKKLVAKSSIATIRIKPHIGVEEIIPEQGLSLIESMRMRLDELEGYINLLKANQLFIVEKDNDGGGE